MRPPRGEWPAQCRLLAATAAIDWARATVARAGEHLRAADRPEVSTPVLVELRRVSTQLASLRREVETAALDSSDD